MGINIKFYNRYKCIGGGKKFKGRCYKESVVYYFNKFIIIFFFIIQRAIGSTGGKSIAHVIEVLEGC